MHRIKIKSPANFYGMNKTFLWVDLSLFNQLLLWRYYNDKKVYRVLAALPFKMSPPSLPLSLASTPWAMSVYFKLRTIYFWLLNEYHWWDQATIYHIIRHASWCPNPLRHQTMVPQIYFAYEGLICWLPILSPHICQLSWLTFRRDNIDLFGCIKKRFDNCFGRHTFCL